MIAILEYQAGRVTPATVWSALSRDSAVTTLVEDALRRRDSDTAGRLMDLPADAGLDEALRIALDGTGRSAEVVDLPQTIEALAQALTSGEVTAEQAVQLAGHRAAAGTVLADIHALGRPGKAVMLWHERGERVTLLDGDGSVVAAEVSRGKAVVALAELTAGWDATIERSDLLHMLEQLGVAQWSCEWAIAEDDGEPDELDPTSDTRWVVSTHTLTCDGEPVASWTRCSSGCWGGASGAGRPDQWIVEEDTEGGGDGLPAWIEALLDVIGIEEDVPDVPQPDDDGEDEGEDGAYSVVWRSAGDDDGRLVSRHASEVGARKAAARLTRELRARHAGALMCGYDVIGGGDD